jgi:hypothetical protein
MGKKSKSTALRVTRRHAPPSPAFAMLARAGDAEKYALEFHPDRDDTTTLTIGTEDAFIKRMEGA